MARAGSAGRGGTALPDIARPHECAACGLRFAALAKLQVHQTRFCTAHSPALSARSPTLSQVKAHLEANYIDMEQVHACQSCCPFLTLLYFIFFFGGGGGGDGQVYRRFEHLGQADKIRQLRELKAQQARARAADAEERKTLLAQLDELARSKRSELEIRAAKQEIAARLESLDEPRLIELAHERQRTLAQLEQDRQAVDSQEQAVRAKISALKANLQRDRDALLEQAAAAPASRPATTTAGPPSTPPPGSELPLSTPAPRQPPALDALAAKRQQLVSQQQRIDQELQQLQQLQRARSQTPQADFLPALPGTPAAVRTAGGPAHSRPPSASRPASQRVAQLEHIELFPEPPGTSYRQTTARRASPAAAGRTSPGHDQALVALAPGTAAASLIDGHDVLRLDDLDAVPTVEEVVRLRRQYLRKGGHHPRILQQLKQLEALALSVEQDHALGDLPSSPLVQQLHALEHENLRLQQELHSLAAGTGLTAGLSADDEAHQRQLRELDYEAQLLKKKTELEMLRRQLRLQEQGPDPDPDPQQSQSAAAAGPAPPAPARSDSPLEQEHDVQSPGTYDPRAGFVVFWDFVTGLPEWVQNCSIVYGLFEQGNARSEPMSVDGEPAQSPAVTLLPRSMRFPTVGGGRRTRRRKQKNE